MKDVQMNVRLIDDQLWCCNSAGVIIFSKHLDKIKSIDATDIGLEQEGYSAFVNDVTKWKDDEVILATSEGLFHHKLGTYM